MTSAAADPISSLLSFATLRNSASSINMMPNAVTPLASSPGSIPESILTAAANITTEAATAIEVTHKHLTVD